MIATQHYRWSDNDYHFGPFLYAPDKSRHFELLIDSGEDEYPGCRLRMRVLGHTLIISLPAIIKPWRKKVVVPEWRQDGTAERLGRDWYYDEHRREYGFSFSKSGDIGSSTFLQIFFGRQTFDSSTTQDWCCTLPWTDFRFVRHSYYGLNGEHFWTGAENTNGLHRDHDVIRDAEKSCPAKVFRFTDFDGEVIECTTHIEEREWKYGTGLFKWLSRFKKPIIHRTLDLDFSSEVGRRKGSWKGGTMGHAIEILPGELHESAFRRYCDGDDRRDGKRNMTFIGEVQ